MDDMTPHTIEVIAAKLALAFDGTKEKVHVDRVIDKQGNPSTRYPRYVEKVEEKTTVEIAETETTKAFVGVNGMISERPLTFLEIIEKLHDLGYEVREQS